jgi:hypothetical protein
LPRAPIALWLLYAAICVGLTAVLGLPTGVLSLLVGGLALVVGPRVQETAQRQPKLALGLASQANAVGEVRAGDGVAPRPVDRAAVIAEARAAAEETIPDPPTTPRGMAVLAAAIYRDEENYNAAHRNFERDWRDFKATLRAWLDEYETAARTRWQAAKAALVLTNAPRGATAEGVEVRLHLPPAVTLLGELPEVQEPPSPPRFPQDWDTAPPQAPWMTNITREIKARTVEVIRAFPTEPPPVQRTEEGALAIFRVSQATHGVSTTVHDRLLLHAEHPGEYVLRWSVHAKNLGLQPKAASASSRRRLRKRSRISASRASWQHPTCLSSMNAARSVRRPGANSPHGAQWL